jgi:hypothetical protein
MLRKWPYDIRLNETQHNDTQHNYEQNVTLSITTLCAMALNFIH